MGITKLRRGVHIIQETEIVHFLRRHLKDPDLITYWDTEAGQWVLAYWVMKDQAVVDIIEGLGPNFEAMTREFVHDLERSRRTYYPRELKEKLLARARRKAAREAEKAEEYGDKYDWLKKRTKEKSPVPYMVNPGRLTGGTARSKILS